MPNNLREARTRKPYHYPLQEISQLSPHSVSLHSMNNMARSRHRHPPRRQKINRPFRLRDKRTRSRRRSSRSHQSTTRRIRMRHTRSPSQRNREYTRASARNSRRQRSRCRRFHRRRSLSIRRRNLSRYQPHNSHLIRIRRNLLSLKPT